MGMEMMHEAADSRQESIERSGDPPDRMVEAVFDSLVAIVRSWHSTRDIEVTSPVTAAQLRWLRGASHRPLLTETYAESALQAARIIFPPPAYGDAIEDAARWVDRALRTR